MEGVIKREEIHKHICLAKGVHSNYENLLLSDWYPYLFVKNDGLMGNILKFKKIKGLGQKGKNIKFRRKVNERRILKKNPCN